jgi:hypothetical protein
MGCPNTFELRRKELGELGVVVADDDAVVSSFIGNASPWLRYSYDHFQLQIRFGLMECSPSF